MMKKTHMAVGAAAALAAVQPQNLLACAAAVTGGALGGIISDVDVLWNAKGKDVRVGLLTCAVLLLGAVLADTLAGTRLMAQLVPYVGQRWIIGLLLAALLLLCGFFSEHRSFTHSLLWLVLFSVSAILLLPRYSLGFMVGIASHLLLDLMNGKPLRLLFPFRVGCCLHWCRASGKVNALLLWLGTAATIGLFIRSAMIWVG